MNGMSLSVIAGHQVSRFECELAGHVGFMRYVPLWSVPAEAHESYELLMPGYTLIQLAFKAATCI